MRIVFDAICLALLVAAVAGQADEPSASPSFAPSFSPSSAPSSAPSIAPSSAPSFAPSASETETPGPTAEPTEPITPGGPCTVDVSITCESTQGGVSCGALEIPDAACGTSLSSLAFTYNPLSQCEDSLNRQDDEIDGLDSCEQLKDLEDEVGIVCEGLSGGSSTGSLSVSPSTVSSGGFLTISSGSTLPDVVSCSIYSLTSGGANDELLQKVLIATNDQLGLKETFGALQVEACGDQSCLVEVEFTYKVTNTGTIPTKIDELTRENDFATNGADIVGLLDKTSLAPKDSAEATETYTVDICGGASFGASAECSANNEECKDEFEFSPSISPPVCDIDAEIECTYQGDDGTEDCSTLTALGNSRCSCAGGCVNELSFLVTANRCAFVPPSDDTLLECTDFMFGPSKGEQIYIMLTSSEGAIYYMGYATVGEVLTISSDTCISDMLSVYTTSDDFMTMLYQSFTFLHNCDGGSGFALNTQYGGFDFVGYTCSGGKEVSCFEDITVAGCAYNQGLVSAKIEELSLELDGKEKDFNGLPTLPSGGEFCGSKTETINLCGDIDELEAEVRIKAGPKNAPCYADDEFKFEPNRAPTPVPTQNIPTPPSSPGTPTYPTKDTYPTKGYYSKGYVTKGKGKGKGKFVAAMFSS